MVGLVVIEIRDYGTQLVQRFSRVTFEASKGTSNNCSSIHCTVLSARTILLCGSLALGDCTTVPDGELAHVINQWVDGDEC